MQRSNQSLQSPRPPHQNYNFISVSGSFGRIFCPFFMTRIQFPRKRFTLTSSVSVWQPPKHPPSQLPATTPLPNKKHRISVRVVQPRPFDTVALPRTHPQPSDPPTHPNHPMKRFNKKGPKPTPQKPQYHNPLTQLPPPKQKAPQTTRTTKLPSRRLRSMPLQTTHLQDTSQ